MRTRVLIVSALLLFSAVAAFAQHDHAAEGAPPIDPKMMEAMMAAGTPGEAQKKLDGMTGSWNATVTWWVAPGTPPMTMKGTSEHKWIMGGRYLEQTFLGDFMGQPFEGVGYTGYDNVKKQYWGTWMDNMSTAMMVSTGGMNADGTWSFTGTFPDPMTGKDQKVQEKITVVDADHHNMEMWTPAPDGKMFKSMAIEYSRKK